VNVTPVLGIVKVEEGAMEEEGGSRLRDLVSLIPGMRKPCQTRFYIPQETDQVLVEGI